MSNNLELDFHEGLTEEQKEFKKKYIETITGSPFVEEYKGPRCISKNNDLDDFISLVRKLINENQKEFKNKIILVDSFSEPNIFENPHKPGEDVRALVTYSLRKRAPGTTAAGNKMLNSERVERTPRFRGALKDNVNNVGQVTFYMGQWFDNEICFDICARTNKEANEIALWFEDLMEENRQFFAYNGILKYYFVERENDAVVKEGDGVVHVRPMIYWLRTEKVYEITEQTINKIIILLTTT